MSRVLSNPPSILEFYGLNSIPFEFDRDVVYTPGQIADNLMALIQDSQGVNPTLVISAIARSNPTEREVFDIRKVVSLGFETFGRGALRFPDSTDLDHSYKQVLDYIDSLASTEAA